MAVTRADVARLAGVSPSVVSYVLNEGTRPVAARTRAQVMAAIEQLGYRPDGLARSFRRGSTRTFGVVLPDASNPFFAELSRAIEDAAFDRGHGVLVGNTADDPAREKAYIDNLAERRIDGLVFVSADVSNDLAALVGLGIPVVVLDRLPGLTAVSTIQTDNRGGARAGTAHLMSHGHRSVAFLGGPDATVTPERRAGWQQELLAHGLPAGREVDASFTPAGGREAGLRLFARPDRPTAVLVSSDVQAFGLLRVLGELGLRVPEDVAVISIDGTAMGQYTAPALTAVAQPITEMGRQAVELLLKRGERHEHVVLPNTLLIRRSCGCQGAA